ncbi:Choline dehydrogenase [Pleurostoma richardsiae]|uniref:Choline dehydrogenase n=1 Tax=Pleurostoma richardsiae TaxID=41990 RepID=A0AA38RN29_9PEZI|nr:Choline dehydrogenase [Pleurostoma richardsiae]
MRYLRALAVISALAQSVSSIALPWQATKAQQGHNPFLAKRYNNGTLDSYDYVVVGSGPGGGPVAANLAIAGFKVLLIDAGGDSGTNDYESIPAMHLYSTEFEDTRWNFFVNHYSDLERQKKDSKMTYRNPDGSFYVGLDPPSDAEPLGIWYPRAGTLGGCSRHNALITINPHDSDWEKIATLTGDDSWSASNMRSYFEKLERNEYAPTSIIGHGFSGWLGTSLTSLSLVVEDQKLLSLIISSATAMGKSLLGLVLSTVAGLAEVLLRDINAPGQTSYTGLYQVPLSMSNNVRGGPRDFVMDTANAVLSNGSRKYHLDIKLNTLVTKIRFDTSGDKPRAVGVDFLEGASLYRADPRSDSATVTGAGSVDANREVIVSGGVFNTPQLLKLSGIGPKDELSKFNITTLVDLPGVGGNMQDRYEATVIGKTQSDFTITSKCTFLQTMPDECLEQYTAGIDPITRGTYGTNGIAIAIVLKSSVAEDEPDLLISGAPAKFTGYFPGYAADSLKDKQHWAWIVLKAHSRNNAGTVTLQSTDPRDMPVINFNSYDTGVNANGEGDMDLQATYEGFEFGRKAFDVLVPLDGTFPEVWPGSNVSSEADVKEFLKDEAWGHHASCTCPIGADDDENAVLTSDFKVRGTEGLRVVDASVFPKIPGFYIALPLYIVSEKASDVIIQEAQTASS